MQIETFNESLEKIKSSLDITQAHACFILGSGWNQKGTFAPSIASVSYNDIPGLGAPQTQSHTGRLDLVKIEGRNILVFNGRRHWYEGKGWLPVAIPVYIAKEFNVKWLILTNSAGSLTTSFQTGELAVISDHINMMGANPLIELERGQWGPDFPDQTEVYDYSARKMIKASLTAAGQETAEAVYLATSGPAYETPAEIRAYRELGADLVGMSTVPEAILANAAGIKVGAVSLASNMAAGMSNTRLTHKEVIQAAQGAKKRILSFMHELTKNIVKT